MGHEEILLDTGTNEVEILEFIVGGQNFGINVAKVQQIIPFEKEKVTAVPNSESTIIGVIPWQESPVNLIELSTILETQKVDSPWPVVLITNFNGITNGFLVDEINRIHRVSWNQINPLNVYLRNCTEYATGSIRLEEKDIILVDFEFIISAIFPETKMSYDVESFQEEVVQPRRENVKIVFAEDSVFIRKAITDFLEKVGFNVTNFENGEDAFKFIKDAYDKAKVSGGDISEQVELVVSDIEMPQMDGLTLCRKIKEDLKIPNLPVIIFSSLINEQMSYKCKQVGADAYITKPKSKELVGIIDNFLTAKK
ncbi:MAG: chemotaxis protein CheV [Nitrospinota bacterium]